MHIKIIGIDADFIAAAKEAFADVSGVTVECISVDAVPRTPGTAFVSPANSLGFMDGGIDLVYSRRMWLGVEPAVKAAVQRHGAESYVQGRFLPIGNAVAVPCDAFGSPGVHLIVAPTMLLPQDVCGTRNAYWAFRAALTAAVSLPRVHTLVMPGLCTGVGAVPAAEALKQMREALDAGPLKAAAPGLCTAHEEKNQPPVYANTGFYPHLLEKMGRRF